MRNLALALIGLVGSLAMLSAADEKSDLVVTLKFVPQSSIRTSSVALPPGVIDRTVDIRVTESREQPDFRVIGTGTNDDDEIFQVRATTDVVPFVGEAVTQLAAAYSLKKGSPADRTLELRLTRFAVTEMNKAIGSTYSAEVHLAFTLKDADGQILAQGAAAGVANRYGRARSGANCSEVLSDALQEAFANTVADRPLQQAWVSGQSSPLANTAGQGTSSTPAPSATIEERLKRLDDLLTKGVISKEEHAARRAAILKEI